MRVFSELIRHRGQQVKNHLGGNGNGNGNGNGTPGESGDGKT